VAASHASLVVAAQLRPLYPLTVAEMDSQSTGMAPGMAGIPKKPNHAPLLVEYGSVRDLTIGGTGMSNEGSMKTDLTRHPMTDCYWRFRWRIR